MGIRELDNIVKYCIEINKLEGFINVRPSKVSISYQIMNL